MEELGFRKTNFWERGFFTGAVGGEAAFDMIKNHIKRHRTKETDPEQLEFF